MQKVMVLTASTRPGRIGPKVAEWFKTVTDTRADMQFEYVDLADINLPIYNEPEHPVTGRYTHEHTKRWSNVVKKFDAFIIVTPEYNNGYPAVLKNALDYLYHEWVHKPVGFVGYGSNGGVRAIEQLRQVVIKLRMAPISTVTHVGFNISQEIDDQGNLTVHEGKSLAANALLDELNWWATTLAAARAKG